ncbi:MAG: nucleotidyltransferase family protein [Actinomycetota bacterium]|nr:nucleotidyltransferase family protein [Actinomycetota bacterium]
MTASLTAAVAARLATLGLGDWGPALALAPTEVAQVLSAAAHEGLVCLLGAALDGGLVHVDTASASQVEAAWAEAMARVVQLDGLLLEVHACLTAAGIDTRVLKGVAIATLDEPDAAWRSYNDIDVLVPATRLLDAADALAVRGMRPAAAPVGRRWAARHAKSLTLTHPSGAQVDLHRMLAAGVFGARLRNDCLFERGREFSVGGRVMTALADQHRFLHACYHAALGGTRGTRHQRDVLLLAQAVGPDAVEPLWPEGWSPAVVAAALRWAGGGDATLPPAWDEWLRSVCIDPADAALLNSYGGSYRELAMAEWRATKGLLPRVRFAAALVWPSSENLRARGRSRWGNLRSLAGAGRTLGTRRRRSP